VTFEETLALVHGAGLRVSNLYQTGTGRWRCNLRSNKMDPRGFQSLVSFYGQGSRPEQALYSAFAMAGQPGGLHMQEKLKSIAFIKRDARGKPSVKEVSLEKLGLGA
jgi:hypothetical protein